MFCIFNEIQSDGTFIYNVSPVIYQMLNFVLSKLFLLDISIIIDWKTSSWTAHNLILLSISIFAITCLQLLVYEYAKCIGVRWCVDGWLYLRPAHNVHVRVEPEYGMIGRLLVALMELLTGSLPSSGPRVSLAQKTSEMGLVPLGGLWETHDLHSVTDRGRSFHVC